MTDADPTIRDAAIAWHVDMSTMPEERWHAFVLWLEADPAHAAAYDAVALADAHLAQAPPMAPRIEPMHRRILRRPLWVGGALAASLAALFAVTTTLHAPQGSGYSVATVAGSTRTIALGEGSAVTLNGGTRMAFDSSNPRSATLQDGEALFSVRHDPAKPFEVALGRFRVVDLGTVFNIVRSKGRLSVAVAEGSVLFDPDGARLTLRAGEALTVDETANTLVRSRAVKVGGWRDGEMEFAGATLGDVAEAIHRRTGADIVVSAPLSSTPFTGNVHFSGNASQDVRHLAELVGADIQRDGEKWLLSSPRAAD